MLEREREREMGEKKRGEEKIKQNREQGLLGWSNLTEESVFLYVAAGSTFEVRGRCSVWAIFWSKA